MGQLLLLLVVALTVAAVVFGVTVLVSGNDPGLAPVEPDGRAVPLPGDRPLAEHDVSQLRFDTALRGYRMGQVDQALRRAAYDIGYKEELIRVLHAEVVALRAGRTDEAETLRRAREAAAEPGAVAAGLADALSGPPTGPGIDLGLRTDPPTGEPAGAAPAVGPLVVGPGAPVVAGPAGPVPDDPPVGAPGAAPAAAPAIGDPAGSGATGDPLGSGATGDPTGSGLTGESAGSGATRADEVSAKHR